ncbi:MAG: SAM-dependent DNA methyltransferase [Parcubacteria group bacterium]|nr:SAM-dependent DNA methyltransferase [Parcubacteria group bacterium]
MLKGEEGLRFKKLGAGFLYEINSLPKEMRERIESTQNEAVEKAITAGTKHHKDIDFEKELWNAADKLRGNIDAGDYKHVVLGLLFLKYISDAFYMRRAELEKRLADPKDKDYYIADEKGRAVILENRDSYRSARVFYIPKKARWEHLREHASHADIGKYIDDAMVAVEDENLKQLKGVLPKIFTRTPLESHILGELVNIFSRIKFNHDIDQEKDMLGGVYEYFLGQFASAEGKRGGEFFTPRSIVRLLVEVLEPYENARIFDPAAGSGGMFVRASSYLKAHGKDPARLAVFGQESNTTTWRLCRMNLAIQGIFGDIQVGNSYYDDKFPDLRADFVLANPPFNAEWEPHRLSENDPRLKYGAPPASNANFTWIQHFIHHLAPNGMAGFVMANGALAVGGREGEIRKKIIENDLVDVIVACPPKLFYNVGLPVSLWFVAKNKKGDRFRNRAGETLFIDAREQFEQISRRQVTFTDEHIRKIADTVRAWRGEKGAPKYEDVPGFCEVVRVEEITKAGFVLTPGRYVGLADEIDDGVPFEEKVQKLSAELKDAFKKNNELEERIISNVKKLGA